MRKTKTILIFTLIFTLATLGAACGSSSPGGDMKPIQTKKTDDNLTVTLSNDTGKLKNGKQELMLAFTDASGNPAEISAASLNFMMPAMGTMAEMNDPATLTTTGTPGQFKGSVTIEMPGEWQAQITYEGKSGKGKVTFPLTAN
ncbi:MAG: FixH family protein [Pyrinomonadaceae bacterium]|nr:FixH family protein [Pyrinomonadaceae bacterium]